MPRVITVGETMVSFTPCESGRLRYVPSFTKRIAGAESNVAISLARLGCSSGWMSRLGEDEFGKYIYREIRAEGVDVSHVSFDGQNRTGIMFKQLNPARETSVTYYRADSAASHMEAGWLDGSYFSGCEIFHFTGITPALSPSCREMLFAAIDMAKRQGAKISFDPNIRLKLWDARTAKQALTPFLEKCDILLAGEGECEILLGTPDPVLASERFLDMGLSVAAIKLGERGCYIAGENIGEYLPAFPVKTVVDPVGAGDAFSAGFLCGILENQPLPQCARMGNAMGAVAVQSPDDYQSLPDREELERLLSGVSGIDR